MMRIVRSCRFSTSYVLENQQITFIITGYIKPEYFCDREKEAERIISKITSGENMVVMAARRAGR